MNTTDSTTAPESPAEVGQVQRRVRPRAAGALEARKTNARISMEQWLAFLDTAALTAGFRGRIAADTGPECWQDYYDDGYTPTQALAEDLHHALELRRRRRQSAGTKYGDHEWEYSPYSHERPKVEA